MNELKNLFMILVNYHFRMKMIHWNAIGKNFNSIHNDSEECATMLNEFIDEVAEIIKCMNGTVPSLVKCIKQGDADYEFKDFNSHDAYLDMKTMVDDLIRRYQTITNDLNILNGVKSKLDDSAYQLTVMKYKLNQRTKNIEDK